MTHEELNQKMGFTTSNREYEILNGLYMSIPGIKDNTVFCTELKTIEHTQVGHALIEGYMNAIIDCTAAKNQLTALSKTVMSAARDLRRYDSIDYDKDALRTCVSNAAIYLEKHVAQTMSSRDYILAKLDLGMELTTADRDMLRTLLKGTK